MKYRRIVASHSQHSGTSSRLLPISCFSRFFFFGWHGRAGDAYLLRFIFIPLVRLSRGENLSGFCRRFHSMLKDYARTATTVAASAASPSNEEMARRRTVMATKQNGKSRKQQLAHISSNTEWLWQCVVCRRRPDAPNILNRM